MASTFTVQTTHIRLQGFFLPNGLVVDELTATGEGLSFEPETGAYALSGEGSLIATIGEAALSSFLETQLPYSVRKVEVQLVGGRIQVAAIAKVVFEIKAVALMQLELIDEKALHVNLESVEPAPVRGLIEGQLQRLNPVFTVDDLPFKVRLERTEIEAGQLRVYGKFELP